MAKIKDIEHGNSGTNGTSPLSDDQVRMLEALQKHNAIISEACKVVGIGRRTHYNWLGNEAYAQAYADIEESAIDHVESKMFERIDEGSDGLIKFYLATKGKTRGYVEKNELELSGEIKIPQLKWADE